jgi:acetyl-CoA carboxylase biotin carboxyl carrier protein
MSPGEKPRSSAQPAKPDAGNPAASQDIFDVRKIRRLVELMKQHDLGEIDLRQGDTRIQLRRAGIGPVQVAATAAQVLSAPPPAMAEAARPQAAAAAAPADSDKFAVIKSPMVGTFYAAPDPESPPYAKVGDHVGPDTTVCIVEAMKVFNQIPAELSGKIVAVLVENGEPVEFGQPLFKVDTRG